MGLRAIGFGLRSPAASAAASRARGFGSDLASDRSVLPWVTERSIRSGFGSTSSDSEATGSSESDFTGFLSTTAARAFCARSRLVGGLDLVLTPDQASLIRGRIYNRAKKAQGGDSGNQYTEPKRHSDALAPPQKTSERLADDLGVSPRTVERD